MGDLSMYGILNTGLLGVYTSKLAMSVVAHNISNANTPGYSRQRPIILPTPPIPMNTLTQPSTAIQFGTGSRVKDVQRVRDEFLDIQYRQINNRYTYWNNIQGNVHYIEQLLGEPGSDSDNSTGLRKLFDDFWSSIEEVKSNPQNAKGQVIDRANAMINTMKDLDYRFKQLQDDVNNEMKNRAQQVNTTFKLMADLNSKIRSSQAAGSTPNDLLDERDRLIDGLSDIADLQVITFPTGEISLRVGDRTVLNGSTYVELKAYDIPGTEGFVNIYANNIKINFSDGKMASLFELRDKILPFYRKKLDEIGINFADTINLVHQEGWDSDGKITGANFFSDFSARKDIDDPRIFRITGYKYLKNGPVDYIASTRSYKADTLSNLNVNKNIRLISVDSSEKTPLEALGASGTTLDNFSIEMQKKLGLKLNYVGSEDLLTLETDNSLKHLNEKVLIDLEGTFLKENVLPSKQITAIKLSKIASGTFSFSPEKNYTETITISNTSTTPDKIAEDINKSSSYIKAIVRSNEVYILPTEKIANHDLDSLQFNDSSGTLTKLGASKIKVDALDVSNPTLNNILDKKLITDINTFESSKLFSSLYFGDAVNNLSDIKITSSIDMIALDSSVITAQNYFSDSVDFSSLNTSANTQNFKFNFDSQLKKLFVQDNGATNPIGSRLILDLTGQLESKYGMSTKNIVAREVTPTATGGAFTVKNSFGITTTINYTSDATFVNDINSSVGNDVVRAFEYGGKKYLVATEKVTNFDITNSNLSISDASGGNIISSSRTTTFKALDTSNSLDFLSIDSTTTNATVFSETFGNTISQINTSLSASIQKVLFNFDSSTKQLSVQANGGNALSKRTIFDLNGELEKTYGFKTKIVNVREVTPEITGGTINGKDPDGNSFSITYTGTADFINEVNKNDFIKSFQYNGKYYIVATEKVTNSDISNINLTDSTGNNLITNSVFTSLKALDVPAQSDVNENIRLEINGTNLLINTKKDTLQSLVDKINGLGTGVSAYITPNGRFVLRGGASIDFDLTNSSIKGNDYLFAGLGLISDSSVNNSFMTAISSDFTLDRINYLYNKTDMLKLDKGLGLINRLQITDALTSNPSVLAIDLGKVESSKWGESILNPIGSNNVTVWEELSKIRTLPILNDGKDGFNGYMANMVAELGIRGETAKKMSENSLALKDQIEGEKERVMGVSLDEEMSSMIKYQQAYNASARVVTAVDQMIDKIVNGLGSVGR